MTWQDYYKKRGVIMKLSRRKLRRLIYEMINEKSNVSVTDQHPALVGLESALVSAGLEEGVDYINLIKNPVRKTNISFVDDRVGYGESMDDFLSKCYFAITEKGMQKALGGGDISDTGYDDDNVTAGQFDDNFLVAHSSKLPMKVIKDPDYLDDFGSSLFDVRTTDFFLIVHATAEEPTMI